MAARRISGVLLLVHVALAVARKCSTGFSVVAPEAAVPGKTTAILVTLHGRADEALDALNVTVRLESQGDDDEAKLLTTASQMITNYGIITLKIPSSPASHCTLHTTVGCAGDDDCTSRSHSSIRLLGPVRDVIVRPAKHHYRPGDMITFWLLALDHDLRLVRDELAYVALMDPAGTKVAVWEQLSLDEGVRKLTIALAGGARSGSWSIMATCGGGSAKVDLEVSAGSMSSAPAAPAAERHSVELRFADSMRRRYKPGLPFVGRVEAVSTEKKVQVRVKLYDDKTDIYSQDIDMSAGEGSFTIPTVMADAPYVNLQAELVSVEGKEIETHYVLARERIHRWNSTAKCYLLIENLPTPLQAGNEASVSVWSSCGCRERLLAAVTSGGRAVHWAAVPPPAPPAPRAGVDDLCRFNHTFPVTADMAPLSSLLVYYVTAAGEPVSDVADFHVKLLHKEVAVAVEERRWWYPRASLQLRVQAAPDSTMCLVGARAPGDGRGEPRQSPSERVVDTPEFVSAGVSLFVGGGACGGGVLYRQRTAPPAPAPAHLVPPAAHDRLWMWRCFNYTSQLATDGVTIAAPSEAGRWSLWALSLSPRGLRFSSPRTINVFRPIQLDFTLPPTLRVGETVEVDVKITNNINSCMDVTALLALTAGASFASTGALYVTERLRLGPRGGTQLVVKVAVNTAGRKNITVEVTGFGAENCSAAYVSFSNETLVGSVIRAGSVLVLPEGLHKSDTESAYFCANEHLAVSSRGSWEWQWVPAPRNRAGLVLDVRSQGAAHVALSAVAEPTEAMYRVVFERSRVWIARGKYGYDVHLASAEQTALDADCGGSGGGGGGGWCSWWLWWEGGRLSVGRGAAPAERRLLVWPLAQDVRVKFVGFSALWGDKADFRIWNFNEEAGFSQVLELGLPHGVVPGSASGTLLISGGLHLPLFNLLDGSQWTDAWKDSQLSGAIVGIAPLLALEHIPHLVDDDEKERILKKLPEQVQIILSFRKSDNSFSDHPSINSHVSTIQVLEVLSKIQAYYPIDPELLQSTKKWIYKRQNADGSFTPLSNDNQVKYYPVELMKANKTDPEVLNEYFYYNKDGKISNEDIEWERKVEITAETLTALLEIGVENMKDANVVQKAQAYLEKNLHNLTSPAALASSVLALVLARSPAVPEALSILKNASTTEEGEFGWPPPKENAADWLFEDSRNIKTTSYEAVTIEQYTAAARVLLAACARGSLPDGEAAARFLYYRARTPHAHPALAYQATKAAARYAALAHDRHRSLTVSLATAGMELTDTLELRAKTAPKALQLPGMPTKVFVYATGAGCATVQGTIVYSTYTPKPDNALLSIQSAIIEEIRPERSSIEDLQGNLPTLNVKTCFRWKGRERSGILKLEVSLFSGYELHSVNPVVLDGGTFADLHYGSRGEFIWFVFANISLTCPVCITYQVRSRFLITSLRPAYAKIFPSTRPDLAVETFFHAGSGSLLLRGITDDDFITWFDKTELASIKINANIDNICECGRICSREYDKLDIKANTKNISKVTNANTKLQGPTSTMNPVTTTKVAGLMNIIMGFTTMTPNILILNQTIPATVVPTLIIKDDAIIIPTSVKVNKDEHSIDNNIVPLLPKGSELITQKMQIKKSANNTLKNKSMPRRKGTLKSTYGDKHESFFFAMNISTAENRGSKVKSSTITDKKLHRLKAFTTVTNITSTTPATNSLRLNRENKFLTDNSIVLNKTVLNKKYNKGYTNILDINLKPSTTEATTMANVIAHVTKKHIKTPVWSNNSLSDNSIDLNKTVLYEKHIKENINNSDIIIKPSTTEATTIAHVIAHVTKNNIKTLVFQRTKKPQEDSQLRKPKLEINENRTVATNKSTNLVILTKNMNEMHQTVHSVFSSKEMSINKEIHKVPSTPISETTKIVSEAMKPDIAPEDKGQFKLLEKSHVWELLKEGSHITQKLEKSFKKIPSI